MNTENQKNVATPNDPKLSDGGGLAADVPVGSAGLPHSGCQTGAVRCSAVLGDLALALEVLIEKECSDLDDSGPPTKEVAGRYQECLTAMKRLTAMSYIMTGRRPSALEEALTMLQVKSESAQSAPQPADTRPSYSGEL